MSPGTPDGGLIPFYSTSKPDEPVRLFQGRMGIRQGSYIGEGDGALDLVWSSRPKLRFDIPSLSPLGGVRAGDCVLTIPPLGAEAPAHISEAQHDLAHGAHSVGARGWPDQNVEVGHDAPVHRVVFHVVNFWPYLNPRPADAPPEYNPGWVAFEGGGWKITLQAVPGSGKLERALRYDSGYGITHVGKAERVDGSPFSREDAKELFYALHSFLSFARGLWSPPILYVGLDKGGGVVWQDWTVRQSSPWKMVFSWFPEQEAQCLGGVFPGFMRIWQDLDRRDILQVAIHWYVEANLQSGGIEGAVILCQNGLELLAYYIMVHERRILSEQDFRPGGLPAADRLRRLLTEFRLQTAIGPPRFRVNDLAALATAQGWRDAAEALVILRNSIIHPDQRNQARLRGYPVPARTEAWILCLWYFELVLLKWFGYAGNYANRQTIQFSGQTEPMP
jgi:hypothetical protein